MCTKNQLDMMLKQIADYSKELFGDKFKNIILYGSYARGDYDEESDTYEYSLPEVSVNNRDTIIKVYNKANEYKSTVGKEFYNMVKFLVK